MTGQLYTAASGMILGERTLEMVANNLANLSTIGFRAQRPFMIEYRGQSADGDTTNRSVALSGSYLVPGPGPQAQTGRRLDVVLDDDALLAVQTDEGLRYTRHGALQVDADGRLTDSNGFPVLDPASQPIAGLPADASVDVNGNVLDGDIVLGSLRLVQDASGSLVPVGSNLFAVAPGGAEPQAVADPSVRAGWLENSGADALGELVQLMETRRAFETYQRLVSLTMNDVNRKTVNEIAR